MAATKKGKIVLSLILLEANPFPPPRPLNFNGKYIYFAPTSSVVHVNNSYLLLILFTLTHKNKAWKQKLQFP